MKEKMRKNAVIEWGCAFFWLLSWAMNDSVIYLILAFLFAGIATYRMKKWKKQ